MNCYARRGLAVLVTAIMSIVTYWGAALAIQWWAVVVLGKSPGVDVALGIAIWCYDVCVFPLLGLATAFVNVGLDSRAIRRRAAALVGVAAACLIGYWGWTLASAPNWRLLIIISTLTGLLVPNVIGARVVRRCKRSHRPDEKSPDRE
jgi:hypothetical protein